MVYGAHRARASGSYGQGNLYKPGTLTGVAPHGRRSTRTAEPAYNTDWNNLAPSVGATWRPNLKTGSSARS